MVEEKYPSKKLQALDDGIGRVIDLYAILYTNVGATGRYSAWWRGRGYSNRSRVFVRMQARVHRVWEGGDVQQLLGCSLMTACCCLCRCLMVQ